VEDAEAAQAAAEAALALAVVAQAAAEAAQAAAELAETNAEAAEVAADGSENLAQEWAEKAEDSEITGYPGSYSALHHSAKANDAQVAAEAAQLAAETAETNAETAETNAEAAQLAAETARDLAQDYAGDALSYLTSTSDLYDLFDDRFLGSKASDPTLDNDGDALVEGALYWNSTSNVLKAYDGAAWQVAYVPSTDYVAVAGDDMTGPLKMAAGTSNDPSFTFTTDPNTGLYSVSADTLGITAGGSQRATFNATNFYSVGAIHAPNGTAALPALSFNSDSNTGLYRIGSDSLGVSTNGTLRVAFNDTNLNSTVPVYAPAGSAAAPSYAFGSDLDTGIYSQGTNEIGFVTNGTSRMVLTTSALAINGGSAHLVIGKWASAGPNTNVSSFSATPDGQIIQENAYLSGAGIYMNGHTSSGNTVTHILFAREGTYSGSITTNSSGVTAFNTTSDYRLKTGARPVLNAIDRVNSVPVREYKWLSNPSGPYSVGFFAHEMQAVLPEAVFRNKDQVDDKGQLEPQMIDYSKAVPLLWAAVQELSAKVAALEARRP
jgi:hypothetical protein